MNLVEANTRMEGLVTQREKMLKEASAIVVEAMIQKVADKNTTYMEKEIDTMLSSFSIEERYTILLKAMAKLLMNSKVREKKSSDSNWDFGEIGYGDDSKGRKRDRKDLWKGFEEICGKIDRAYGSRGTEKDQKDLLKGFEEIFGAEPSLT